MKTAYWILLPAGALFLGWAHCHTDEIPVVFGMVAITAAVLGALAPRRFFLTWALMAAPVPVVELLVHFSIVTAPYPATPLRNLPLITLVACIPALIGVATGAALRRMSSPKDVTPAIP